MIRIAFAKMITTDALSFRFVEHKGFRHFKRVTYPELKFVHNMVVQDCFSIYMIGRKKLKDVLTKFCQRPYHWLLDLFTENLLYVSHRTLC